MKVKDIISLGFMTLCLFVGAGNIIYPPMVGLQSGSSVWFTAFGFMITGVGLPLVSLIVLSGMGGDMSKLSAPIGKPASIALAVTCYLFIGPFFATPRTATVSFDVAINPFVDPSNEKLYLFIFTFLYFLSVLIISLYPGKILDNVGKILSPLKLLALAFIGIAAFLWPAGYSGTPTGKYLSAPVAQGFLDGYLTMDALAGLVFSVAIVNAIRTRNVFEKKEIIKYTMIACFIAFIGFSAIYISLFKLGNNSFSLVPDAPNGAVILQTYVRHTFGMHGNLFLALLIIISCFVTAIGLTISCSSYFSSLLKLPYKVMAYIMSGGAFAVSNLGLTKLIELSGFALTAIYPPCIVLIILGVIQPWMPKSRDRLIYSTTMGAALIFGVLDALKNIFPSLYNSFSFLPFSKEGLSWLVPVFILFIISSLYNQFSNKSA